MMTQKNIVVVIWLCMICIYVYILLYNRSFQSLTKVLKVIQLPQQQYELKVVAYQGHATAMPNLGISKIYHNGTMHIVSIAALGDYDTVYSYAVKADSILQLKVGKIDDTYKTMVDFEINLTADTFRFYKPL